MSYSTTVPYWYAYHRLRNSSSDSAWDRFRNARSLIVQYNNAKCHVSKQFFFTSPLARFLITWHAVFMIQFLGQRVDGAKVAGVVQMRIRRYDIITVRNVGYTGIFHPLLLLTSYPFGLVKSRCCTLIP